MQLLTGHTFALLDWFRVVQHFRCHLKSCFPLSTSSLLSCIPVCLCPSWIPICQPCSLVSHHCIESVQRIILSNALGFGSTVASPKAKSRSVVPGDYTQTYIYCDILYISIYIYIQLICVCECLNMFPWNLPILNWQVSLDGKDYTLDLTNGTITTKGL